VLRSAFRSVRASHPFALDAIVVLPDHLHCIWTLPPDDADFAIRWRLIKTWFTKHCDSACVPCQMPARRGGWSRRCGSIVIGAHAAGRTDFERHVEYVHYNPVKHGYVTSPMAWPHSSFRGMSRPDI